MANIHDVASFIVEKFDSGISTMKLQKLVFLAHGWSLALRGKTLTDENFVMWPSGPVNKTLQEVPGKEYTVTSWVGYPQNLTEEEVIILKAVVNQYGALSGPQLSEIVSKNAPWNDLKGTGYPLYNDEIKSHYTKTLVSK